MTNIFADILKTETAKVLKKFIKPIVSPEAKKPLQGTIFEDYEAPESILPEGTEIDLFGKPTGPYGGAFQGAELRAPTPPSSGLELRKHEDIAEGAFKTADKISGFFDAVTEYTPPTTTKILKGAEGIITSPIRSYGEAAKASSEGRAVKTVFNTLMAAGSFAPQTATAFNTFNAAVNVPGIKEPVEKGFEEWGKLGNYIASKAKLNEILDSIPIGENYKQEVRDIADIAWSFVPIVLTHKAVKKAKYKNIEFTIAELEAVKKKVMNGEALKGKDIEIARYVKETHAKTGIPINEIKFPEKVIGIKGKVSRDIIADIQTKWNEVFKTEAPQSIVGLLESATPKDIKAVSKRFDQMYKDLKNRGGIQDTGLAGLKGKEPNIFADILKEARMTNLFKDDIERGKITSQKGIEIVPTEGVTPTEKLPDTVPTTRIIEDLQGKDKVSKQFIEDLTKQPKVKQAEREVISKILAEFEGGKINVKAFENKVRTALLPLTEINSLEGGGSRYENITLPDELRGEVESYFERIYESPIKTEAGNIHYGDSPMGDEGGVEGYFAHTRVEDIVNDVRRVIELQSDLMQKGRLDSERSLKVPEEIEEVKGKGIQIVDRFGNTEVVDIEKIKQDKGKLQPYRNTWYERIIREEVKRALQEGKKSILFPTGETAMKVEGLGDTTVNFYHSPEANVYGYPVPGSLTGEVTKNQLKVGITIEDRNGNEWVITEVLEDGKFKAVPKNGYVDITSGNSDRLSHFSREQMLDNISEQFDISGKVDTNNPIYKFYEKTVQKYLKKEYGEKMQRITDEQGVDWFKVDLEAVELEGLGRKPVFAFKTTPEKRGDLSERAEAEAQEREDLRREAIREELSQFTNDTIKLFDKIRRSKNSTFAEGDIDTMKADPIWKPQIEKAVEKYNEATGQDLVDTEAFEEILSLPNLVQKKVAVRKAKVEKKPTVKEKRKTVKSIKEELKETLGLTDSELTKITRSSTDVRKLNNEEFAEYTKNVRVKAVEKAETKQRKNELIDLMNRKEFKKTENLQRAMKLPPVSKMTSSQLNEFIEALEQYEFGDVFLTKGQLSKVDRTDLRGIKTMREARERLSKETGIPAEDLHTIKVDELDRLRFDTALAESNPFYEMMVTEANKNLLNANVKFLEVKNEFLTLAKKAFKSKKIGLKERIVRTLIPQQKELVKYLEASPEKKAEMAKDLTPEELDLLHFMSEHYRSVMDYHAKIESQFGTRFGDNNYYTHIRQGILESIKENGVIKAFKNVFKNYKQDAQMFNILDGDTGQILPLEKFFKFSVFRTGDLDPTQNIVKSFLTYMETFYKKEALDKMIPKLDIYAHSLDSGKLTPKGLEMDRSLTRFVKEWVNNKKGRRIKAVAAQGSRMDLSLRAAKTFVTVMDLGLSIPVGIASQVGEQVATYTTLGKIAMTRGKIRQNTKQGKEILKKHEAFVGENPWKELAEVSKGAGDRLMEGLFILFSDARVRANKTALLGAMTKAEFTSGKISDKRLSELKNLMGRWRSLENTKSLYGSTAEGGIATQYLGWAIPILRSISQDSLSLLRTVSRLGDAKKRLNKQQAWELWRIVEVGAVVAIVGMLMSDQDDDSFYGEIKAKAYRELATLFQAVTPSTWVRVPRTMQFLIDLSKNMTELFTLERYKTTDKKGQLKGAVHLKKQLTPKIIRQFQSDDKKKKAFIL